MLHDRLTNDTDRRYFYKLLSEQLHNGFKTRWTPAELEKTPLIFGDFLEGGSHHSARVYRFVRRYDRLPQILEVSSFVLFVLFLNLESNLIFLLLFILYLILVCFKIYLILGPLCKPLLVMDPPNKRLLLLLSGYADT